MKHWLLAAALVCFGSNVNAASRLGPSLNATSNSSGVTLNGFSSTVAGDTLTVTNYPPCLGCWGEVASSSPVSMSAITFAVDFSSGIWELDFDLWQVNVTTGDLFISINGDSGNNYTYASQDNKNQAAFNSGGTASKFRYLAWTTSTAYAVPQGKSTSCQTRFSTTSNAATTLNFKYTCESYASSLGYSDSWEGGGTYEGTPPYNKLRLLTGIPGAAWAGDIVLLKFTK